MMIAAPVAADDAKPAKSKLALRVGKIITCAGEPVVNGTILVADGKIKAIGPRDQGESQRARKRQPGINILRLREPHES